MQRLADIDVAEPRDKPLVEQRGFQRRLLAGEEAAEHGAVERRAERLDADIPEQRVPGEARSGR